MSNLRSVRRESVLIELNGEERNLKFDLNAFTELENIYGSVQAAMDAMQRGSLKTITTVLWAALIHDQAVLDEITGEPIKYNITRYMVGSWVEPSDLEWLTEKLSKALNGDMVPSEEGTGTVTVKDETKPKGPKSQR